MLFRSQMNFIQRLKDLDVDKNTLVFHSAVRKNGHIPVMFYLDCWAYDFIPTLEQIAAVKSKSFRIVVRDDGTLPEYLMNDASVLRVRL